MQGLPPTWFYDETKCVHCGKTKTIDPGNIKQGFEYDWKVKALADKIWGDCDGKTVLSNNYGKGTVYWGKTLNQVLDILAVKPDFQVIGIDNCERQIDFMHRQTKNEDIFFVINTSFTEQHFTAVFRVDGNRVPEIWDPDRGLVQPEVAYSNVADGISMEFSMDPLVSRFVVFTRKSKGKNDPGLSYDLQFGLHRTEKSAPSVDISPTWQVGFDPVWVGPEQYHMETLKSWTDTDVEGIRYYSGSPTYTREFTMEADALSNGNQAFVVIEDIQNMAKNYKQCKNSPSPLSAQY